MLLKVVLLINIFLRVFDSEQENGMQKNVLLSDLPDKKVASGLCWNFSENSKDFKEGSVNSESNVIKINSINTAKITSNCDDSFYKDDLDFFEILQRA